MSRMTTSVKRYELENTGNRYALSVSGNQVVLKNYGSIVYREFNNTGDLDSEYTATGAVSALKFVASNGNDRVEHASSNNLEHAFKVVGVSLNSAVEGQVVKVRKIGILENGFWSFDPGSYLWLNVNGGVVTARPYNLFDQIVAFAHSSTKIEIIKQLPIRN